MNMYKLFQNISKFLICGLCLSAFCVISCDDSDDQDSPHPHGTVLVHKETEDFFYQFGYMGRIDPFKVHKDPFFADTERYKDTCCIINSYEELNAVYSGEKQLPDIDFSSVTLVIGKAYVPSQNYYIYDQSISIPDAEQKVTLTLTFKNDRMATQAYADLFYWGFYPKFEAKEIKVIKVGNNHERKIQNEEYD